jgi:preprotein translocase subunit SecY
MQKTLTAIIKEESLRTKVLIVLGLLALTRLIASIPLPGVDTEKLAGFLANNQLFEYLSLFSGSGFSTFSVTLLGLGPYITASILVQVGSMVFPQIKKLMHEEGEMGRKKITQYTRIFTIPFAFLQGFALMKILAAQGILTTTGNYDIFLNLLVMTAATMMLLFIGEKITEFGVGNGTSLIIFTGIAASMPGQVSQLYATFDTTQIPLYIVLLGLSLLIIALVVFINEAERRVAITYARAYGQTGGSLDTHLPLKINQAGMIPIIFALALFTMPQFAAQYFASSGIPTLVTIGSYVNAFFANQILYMVVYFFLVFFFTFFYTSVVVEPEEMSKNLHKRGAFVPGIRPGENTTEYLGNIITRITFVGAAFLGFVAVLPIGMQAITGIQALAVGGTSVLIAVSTALETYKKVEAQATLTEY